MIACLNFRVAAKLAYETHGCLCRIGGVWYVRAA